MRNVRLQVAYDGSRFFGWQRQDGFVSVQGTLEEALEELVETPVTVMGAGRTDTGVHALRQVASVHLDTRLDDERLLFALNAHLPEGVVVTHLETCPDDFHALRDSCGKRYAYRVATTRFREPFVGAHAHWTPWPLDLAAMRAGADRLRGRHDFSALANVGSPRRSNVRTIQSLRLVARRSSLTLVVQGDGFLYNMVRTLAGTLLDVGRGKLAPADVGAILASRDRTRAGPTAPAGGLYLVRVRYPEPCFRQAARAGRAGPGVFAM
jgi:tRNA pseudouridine38-40 synthase